jgi:phosphonopyruvate decarboxylase
MIGAADFIEAARGRGFAFYTGVPCSYLQPFINYAISDESLTYVPAANEGDAVAIAAGATLAGKRAVVMMQNSGLGNAVNPLTSLNAIFRIPALLIITLRGEPGGPGDEPQHQLMGEITQRMLDLMQIPNRYFPTEATEVAAVLDALEEHIGITSLPFALIMKKNSVSPFPLRGRAMTAARHPEILGEPAQTRPTRASVLQSIVANTGNRDIVIATTGFTGRVLYGIADRPNFFYMVGSMGCASSLALGLALSRKDLRIIVLDGDGAALMRLGALATIGSAAPQNLLHILLDNECHDSTGGQSTVTAKTDLAAIAAGCGYLRVQRIDAQAELPAILQAATAGPHFVHIKTFPGEQTEPVRPKITPPEVARRLIQHIALLPAEMK